MSFRKDIKIIQISSEPDAPREIKSFNSLKDLGIRYIRHINPRWRDYPPTHNVFDGRVDWIKGITKPNPDEFGLTSGHYGAWQGHISAILSSFVDRDWTIICECDCLIQTNVEHFKQCIEEGISVMESTGLKIVRFEAPGIGVQFGEKISDNLYLSNIMTLGHCYMINTRDRDWWIKQIDGIGWHTPDWWLNFVFERSGEKMGVFKDLVLTSQSEGFSLIDNVFRVSKVR